MVEVEMADGDDVDRVGVEAGVAQRGQDRLAGHSPLCAVVLVHALADARLDQHAPGRRLDQQAVERLVQRVVGVDLRLDEALPHDRGTGPKTAPASDVNVPAWIERDADPAPKVASASRRSGSARLLAARPGQRLGPPFGWCRAPSKSL